MSTSNVLGSAHPSSRSLSDLQQRLWPLTYKNAISTEFYRSLYAADSSPAGHISTPTLDALPIVRKEDLQRAGSAAQATGGEVCREIFTGGSSGRPFVFKVRKTELQFLDQFFSSQASTQTVLRRGIRLVDLNYATSRAIPVPIRFHELSLYGKGNIEYGICLLDEFHDENGVHPDVTVLAGGERALRAFSMCASAEVGPRRLDIVYCYGTYLTAMVRRDLERQWSTSIVDRYALSEVFGGATQDTTNGWYHFEPWVIAEVLDVVTQKPVEEGIGVIVLTSLFPFQQAQPIVRYWTGDLARISHSIPGYAGKPLVRPLGRLGASVLSDQGSLVLLNSEISETIDHSPYLSNIPWFQDNPAANPGQRLGYPCYRVDYVEAGTNSPQPEITISVKWKSCSTLEERSGECHRIASALTDFMMSRGVHSDGAPKISFRESNSVVPRYSGIYQRP